MRLPTGFQKSALIARHLLLAVFALAAMPTWALDYLSVGEAAVLYDGPSLKAKPMYAIARGTPVEQVVALGGWIKVRDPKGDLAWMEKSQLSPQRTVIVRSKVAQIRAEPADGAMLVFEAEAEVILEFVGPGVPGWVQVRHAGGQNGFVKVTQVWGS
jgi:SH3-like domain-containing protein